MSKWESFKEEWKFFKMEIFLLCLASANFGAALMLLFFALVIK